MRRNRKEQAFPEHLRVTHGLHVDCPFNHPIHQHFVHRSCTIPQNLSKVVYNSVDKRHLMHNFINIMLTIE